MTNVEDTVNKEYIDKHEAYLLLKHKAETYMLPATKEAYEKAAILIDSLKTHEVKPVNQEIIELLNECRETIFGATYTSGEEYTHAITLCDKISAVIGEG